MAIVLNGTTHQLRSTDFGASRPTAYTIALWFRANAVPNSADAFPMVVGNSAAYPSDLGDLSITWSHNNASYRNAIALHRTGANYSITSQGSSAATTWKHWTAKYSGSNISLFENGAQIGSDVAAVVTAAAPADWYVVIGSIPTYVARFAGKVCMCAYWDESLTNDECRALGKGFSPIHISPQNLRFFIPGFRSANPVRGTVGTSANLTFDDDNPRIIN